MGVSVLLHTNTHTHMAISRGLTMGLFVFSLDFPLGRGGPCNVSHIPVILGAHHSTADGGGWVG